MKVKIPMKDASTMAASYERWTVNGSRLFLIVRTVDPPESLTVEIDEATAHLLGLTEVNT